MTSAAGRLPGVACYHCDYAWLGGEGAVPGVNLHVDGDRFSAVEPGPPPPGCERLRGLSLPGFANAHSHAFHRVLRGRSERGHGSFWTWRELMYGVADLLQPDGYLGLATAVYAEMALAGYTAVGEFHYLHHDVGGAPYAEPNVMGAALIEAAARAGLRITLLDACYLQGGPGRPLAGAQLRFGDAGAEAWERRTDLMQLSPGARLGAAIHSMRAVPPSAATAVAAAATRRGAPLHVHLSEQPAENEAVAAAYGASPALLLEGAGALGPRCVAVHATHLEPDDRLRIAGSQTAVCMCPTTERDLADGIGPAHELARLGSPLCLGSDSQAVVDPFEELRALELDERLRSGERGRFGATELLGVATAGGHRALGWAEAGMLAAGQLADVVTVSLESPRLGGALAGGVGTGGDGLLEQVVFSATAADVSDVVVSGRRVVAAGRHLHIDVPAALSAAIGDVLAGR